MSGVVVRPVKRARMIRTSVRDCPVSLSHLSFLLKRTSGHGAPEQRIKHRGGTRVHGFAEPGNMVLPKPGIIDATDDTSRRNSVKESNFL